MSGRYVFEYLSTFVGEAFLDQSLRTDTITLQYQLPGAEKINYS